MLPQLFGRSAEVPMEQRDERRRILAQKAEERHEAALIRGLGPKAAERIRRRDAEDRPGAGLDLGEISTCSGSGADYCSSSHTTVLTVIRTRAWGSEDQWQVEVPESATALEVKRRIWQLFGVPMELQRLQCTPDLEDECLDDSIPIIDVLGSQAVVLYLLPAESDPAAPRHGQAVEARLQDAEYDLHVIRPEDAGGRAAGKRVRLRLGALTPILEAQMAAEVALLDGIGVESAFLSFAGRSLPHHLSLYHAGVGDGDTLVLAHTVEDYAGNVYADSESDSDSFDAAMQRWA